MNPRSKKIARRAFAVLALSLAAVGAFTAPASAAPAPRLAIESIATPTQFTPGDVSGNAYYEVEVTNIGAAPTSGPITITDNLPAGLTLKPDGNSFFQFYIADSNSAVSHTCSVGPPAKCTYAAALPSDAHLTVFVPVNVDPAAPALVTNQVSVSGGGSPSDSASEDTPVGNTAVAPAFQAFHTMFNTADGTAATQAGSHPFRLNLDLQFRTKTVGGSCCSAVETPKKVVTVLPPGTVVNPQATASRCTEDQFQHNLCPDSSAVGYVHTGLGALGGTRSGTTPLYNMVAPRGTPAVLGFVPVGFPIFVHLIGHVRADGDYALSASADDILEFGNVTGVGVTLWGDPSDPSHDNRRGRCGFVSSQSCPVSPSQTPFLTMPTACSSSLTTHLTYYSWQHPAVPLPTSSEAEDLDGNPVGVAGCDQLVFDPTLQARPTTNAADSPSGLDVDLHVPQRNNVDTVSTAHLKTAVVTLPPGLVLNPSAANGLGACSSAQIGIDPKTGVANENEPTCPSSSRIGSVEVITPLVPDPLVGSIFLAQPGDNPFNSQLAIYLVVDDPQTAVVIKLAGHAEADPSTGQLTTTFDNNPQLPFSDFKLNFFAGAKGVLRTPATCGPYSTASELTPWSGNAAATPHDDYAISQGPNGSCVSSENQQLLAPSFDAGSVSPLAGEHTPFVLSLRREDGTQQFSKVTLSPPPGLVAKLAGTPACTDSQIAQAEGRTASGGGALEQSAPSCPAASQVGTVTVGAGAGPAPYYAPGKVYLSGPYKGQPISLTIITPAVAGPFDLGVVVTRVAIAINPITTQITANADPIPDRLTVDGNGFLLDVRSVVMKLDRPDFTLNGTSCDPGQISGSLLSVFGQSTLLSQRFQLAECANLGFKPSISLNLKGGTTRSKHPQLTVVLKPRPGDANIASLSLAMPHSEFLEQAHIRTVCTRVQFAADACPRGGIYGHAWVESPLLDSPLDGNVYLRSSDNPLPDLVPDLRGPAYQPVRIEAAGRTDSVHGGIRSTFDFIPDAPFTKLVTKLQGGSKGLLVNSRNICAHTYRATVKYKAHNGDTFTAYPKVHAQCKRKHQKRHHGAQRSVVTARHLRTVR